MALREQTKHLATDVSPDIAERFRAIAKDNDRSGSAELRRVIERYVLECEGEKGDDAE